MQKELDRYLSPVLRKKYKTDLHLKKYPPKNYKGIPLWKFLVSNVIGIGISYLDNIRDEEPS